MASHPFCDRRDSYRQWTTLSSLIISDPWRSTYYQRYEFRKRYYNFFPQGRILFKSSMMWSEKLIFRQIITGFVRDGFLENCAL
ncbi:hypothetical protein WN943_010211 [Citrus x changshan-huyou]